MRRRRKRAARGVRPAWAAAIVIGFLGAWAGGAGAGVALAEVYHYKDREGILHFTNVPRHSRFQPLFTGRGRSAASIYRMEAAALKRLVADAARRHDLDPSLITAVIKAESGFDTQAVSPAGAQGLMQLMPATAELLNVADPFDPEANISGGVRHLRGLLDRFDGDLPLALAAYNAGASRVEAAGAIPAIAETREYVERVLRYYQDYRRRSAVSRPGPPIRRVVAPDGTVLLTNSSERDSVTVR